MGNTLTNLIPTIYAAADIVMRELTGFIPAVTLDASGEQVAKDQALRYPIVPANAASDIVPAATGPDPSAVTIGSDFMTISKVRSVTFFWEAEEQKSLGGLYDIILRDQFAQAMRTLTNEVETDLAALYVAASRAHGTAGTTPFASDLSDAANLLKILKDNGAPTNDLQLVINTTAGAKLRTLTQLTKANEAGSTDLLRRGILLDVFSFAIRESAQIGLHTKGTGTGYLVNSGSGLAVGETTIPVDTGSGTILAGDIVTFAADTANKYVVTSALSGGSFKIAKPGLRVAIPDNNAVTVGNNYTPNLGFSRSAIHLLMRVPAMPLGGDAADDVTVITDPQTGISFQVAMYRQRRRIAYEVALAWGVKAVKPEAIATLLG
ncbi:P22 coat protein - gene protein 5 [Bellilinea caldifistulae]|uniref:p22 coat-protein 5 family protein n=1 Tax=Bellilinea caldifistulae TaxID=360411 RepID=A0A0P6X555_9CHLR|nr:P22 phage major capsid protein family protein [Bellilinea caldifistulae]KPL74540.1 P22 coat - protein 5 family protein [Bellilinea caldifistulae]GAP11749.1 P22 coat protein - gene protein 5 [Bellilinea caldifistulae]